MALKQHIYDFVKLNPHCSQGDVVNNRPQGFGGNFTRSVLLELVSDDVIAREVGVHNRHSYFVLDDNFVDDTLLPDTQATRKRKRNNEKMFVYAIGVHNEGPIKIGVTKSLNARLRFLQTGHYKSYYVAFAILVENAFKVEAFLHDMFEDRRIKNEWFDVSSADVMQAVFGMELP